MQLYFIRHAQSSNNALWDETGNSSGRSEDPELSEKGEAQAEILAWNLMRILDEGKVNTGRQNQTVGNQIHLYSSLMVRALKTGQKCGRKLGLPLKAWPAIHEGGGIYLDQPENGEKIGLPGKNKDYLIRNFPELVLEEEIAEEGWWNRPYETAETYIGRAEEVGRELIRRHGRTNDQVVMFSHAGFYNSLLGGLLGISRESRIWFAMNNCGITRIDFDDWETRVVYTNRTDFLPIELMT